jgi:hypothetical protein
MIEVPCRFGLAMEPLNVGTGGKLSGENDLQGDDAVETLLPGPVDDPHAAPGDLLKNLIITKVVDFASHGRVCRLAFTAGQVLRVASRTSGTSRKLLLTRGAALFGSNFEGRPLQKTARGAVGR